MYRNHHLFQLFSLSILIRLLDLRVSVFDTKPLQLPQLARTATPPNRFLWPALVCLGLVTIPLDARAERSIQLSQTSLPGQQTAEPAILSIGAEPVTGSLTADSPKLQDGSYVGIHRFNGQENQIVVLEMTSSDFDAYLLLSDPQGNKIAENDDGAGGSNARIVVRLPATGTYIVGANSAGAGETGAYQLRIRTGTAQELAEAERSTPDTTINSIGATPVNLTGSLTTDSPTLPDGSYYSLHLFNGQANQTVVLELTSEDFNAYLLLLDSEENKIAEDDDSAGGNNARITVTLPATGIYAVIVNSSGAGETGAYQLRIRTGTAQGLSEAERSAPESTVLSIGAEPITGSLTSDSPTLSDGSRYSLYRFNGQADQIVVLELTSSDFDAYLLLNNPQDQRIAEDNDGADGNNARIVVKLPATGTYVIGANSYGAEATGTYQLSIRAGTDQELAAAEAITQANRLLDQGVEQVNTSRYREALQAFQQALEIYQQDTVQAVFPQQSRSGEAKALMNLGTAYLSLSQYQKAIEYSEL